MESSPADKGFSKSGSLKIRKPRVLVFDDEDVVLNNLKIWLSKKGYEVFTFNNPTGCPIYEKKSDSCMKEKPCTDIIITDYKMPEMNGIDFLKYQTQRGCKIDKKNKAIISGCCDDKIMQFINESGYSFFEKPFDLSLMSDWLSGCKQRVDLSVQLVRL